MGGVFIICGQVRLGWLISKERLFSFPYFESPFLQQGVRYAKYSFYRQ